MSTRDAARTQRLREEDLRRDTATRRNKPQAKKAKSNNTVITLTAGMVIGCLLFWFLGSKGFLPVGGTPVATEQPPAAGGAETAAPVQAKRIQPAVDLSFYSQLPAGSASPQTLEQVGAANNGVPEFPEVKVEPVAQAAVLDPALAAGTPQVDASQVDASQVAAPATDTVATAPIPEPIAQPSAEPVIAQPVAVAPLPVQPVAPVEPVITEPAIAEQPAAKVEEKEVKAEPAKPAAAKQTSTYYLQVGTFKTMSAVENQRAQLAFSGVSASVRSGKDGSGQPIYRLVVGPFSSPQAAAPTKAKLASSGISSFITR